MKNDKANSLEFTSRFLQDVHDQFLKRRKALSHRGTLRLERKPDADASGEKLLISLAFSDWPLISVAIDNKHQGTLSVLSQHRSNKGKTLVEVEDVVLVDDPHRIENAFEEVITNTVELRDGRQDLESVMRLRSIWYELGLRIV